MLASTVQFSTNKQPPPHRPHPTRTPHKGPGDVEPGTALPRESPRTANGPGPAPSGPNSVPTATPPPAARFHAPHRGAVLGAGGCAGGRTGQRSTLEHHPGDPGPTRNWAGPLVLTWPWTGTLTDDRPAAP